MAPLLIKQHSGVLVYKGAPPQSHPSHCVELHTVVSSFPGWRRIHTFRANNMDFSGTWQVYAQENYEEFLKAMGKRRGWVSQAAARVSDVPLVWNFSSLFFTELPADVIKMAKDIKPITEIKQSGNDFVITSKTPGKTVTNSFTIGKESEITTMDGKKLKVCPSLAQKPAAKLLKYYFFYMFVFCCIFVKFTHAWCCKCQLGDDVIVTMWSCHNYFLPHYRLLFFLNPLIRSALSIWRVAKWSATPASSVTSRSWREERWLRCEKDCPASIKMRDVDYVTHFRLWTELNTSFFPQTLTMGSTTLVRKSKKM